MADGHMSVQKPHSHTPLCTRLSKSFTHGRWYNHKRFGDGPLGKSETITSNTGSMYSAPEDLGQRSWATGPGSHGMGHMSWVTGL